MEARLLADGSLGGLKKADLRPTIQLVSEPCLAAHRSAGRSSFLGWYPVDRRLSATATNSETGAKKLRLPPRPPWWNPRIWIGCSLPALLRLLNGGGWRVAPRYGPIVAADLVASCYNSAVGGLEWLLFGRAIERTQIHDAPLFILGHWRSGTTLLHELLIQDGRHTFPNNYDCFSPNHFLITEWFATRVFGFLLAKQRAMDNMPVSWDRPQEDEFALVNLGLPSPYSSIAFPNESWRDLEYYDLETVSPAARERWKAGFLRFLKRLTFRTPKRMVLKSPPHTFRIRVLLEMFPDARFVHIVRDPYVLFSSTLHLWRSLYVTQGLQDPNFAGLEEQVFDTFARMHQQLQATRSLVPDQRFHELRYEDLVAAPLDEMRKLYDALDLGEFEAVRPALEKYLEGTKDYRTNRYELDPTLEAEITRRWAEPIRQYGYERTAHGNEP